MSDGTVLRGDLVLPAKADGTAVDKRLPVIVTITAYNKSSGSVSGGLTGSAPDYLVQRGYAHLTVDARGTGSSEGQWARVQPARGQGRRRDRRVGALPQAPVEQRPDRHERPVVPRHQPDLRRRRAARRASRRSSRRCPAADVYRDVVASGGQVDVGFIPLWLGLVTGTGVIPPAVTATDPESGFGALRRPPRPRPATFTLPLLLDAVTGGDSAYDGKFYRDRSP